MCARKDGAIPGQRGDALRYSGHLGRKQSISLLPPPRLRHPSVAGVKRVDLILVNSLPAHSASGAARREALCLSGHTELVPEDARRT
jgi:hypothetical protein